MYLRLVQVVQESIIFPSGNILDLVLCLHSERVSCVDVPAPFSNYSHGMVKFSYVFQEDPG